MSDLTLIGRVTLAGAVVGLLACANSSAKRATLASSPEDRFWAHVEHAREGPGSCGGIARRLETDLASLPADDITEFNTEMRRRLAESYRWDLWAVAYVANGGSSDDGFDYFRGWLLTQGRATYNETLRDPASAVRWTLPWSILECEDILAALHRAYKAVTDSEPSTPSVAYPSEPVGQRWSEDSLRIVYPTMVSRVKRWRWLYAWGI